MELGEIRDKVLQHEMSISNIDNWAANAEKRIAELEKSRDLMSDIKVALAELKMSNRYLTEKFDELKSSIDNITKDNKEQHKAICDRVDALEDKPGKRWDTLWVVVLTAIVGIAAGILSSKLFPGI